MPVNNYVHADVHICEDKADFVLLQYSKHGVSYTQFLSLFSPSYDSIDGSRDSLVGIATGYGLDDEGERDFESR
jgi:hypothetical protein